MPFTPAELKERAKFLGGSEAAAALGLCNFFTPLQLYQSKIGEGEPIEETLPMAVGTALEATTIAWFEKQEGIRVHSHQKLIKDRKLPWRRATLDGLSSDGGIVEAKSSGMYGWWGKEDDAVPQSVIFQCQHNMACSELHFAWVPVILGQRTFRVYRVERDEELIELLTEAESAFWHCVKARTPPPPLDADDLKILYPSDTGKSIIATAEIEEQALGWAAAKAKIKALESEEEDLAFQLKQFMGEAAILLGTNRKPLATWKAHQRRNFDITKFRADYAALADQYMAESTVRSLLNKVK